MPQSRPTVRQAIWRGVRRRCPRCGVGAVFHGWFAMNENCRHCDLKLGGAPGDLWGFWVFTDRIVLFGALVTLLFIKFTIFYYYFIDLTKYS